MPPVSGSGNVRAAKLTRAEVDEIRAWHELIRQIDLTRAELAVVARLYHVSPKTIEGLLRGDSFFVDPKG